NELSYALCRSALDWESWHRSFRTACTGRPRLSASPAYVTSSSATRCLATRASAEEHDGERPVLFPRLQYPAVLFLAICLYNPRSQSRLLPGKQQPTHSSVLRKHPQTGMSSRGKSFHSFGIYTQADRGVVWHSSTKRLHR